MFYTGVQDYLSPIDARDIAVVETYTEPPAPLEFLEVAEKVMEENSLEIPTNVEQAIDLYILLTSTIEAHIN